MMRICILISVLTYLQACEETIEKPLRVNETSNFVFSKDTMHFKSNRKNWSAILYSFTQPIILTVVPEKEGFYMTTNRKTGITEGPANLCLINGDKRYFYTFNLMNKLDTTTLLVDYRSPKTVNPDSCLNQQSIRYCLDNYKNIKLWDNIHYFQEKEYILPPIAKTYRAIDSQPITAYYMQPGSCVLIPIHYRFISEKNQYEVTVGKLLDKYGNNIANGSLIRFIYTGGEKNYRQESMVKDGYASAIIPAIDNPTYTLYAETNSVKSETIMLARKQNEVTKIQNKITGVTRKKKVVKENKSEKYIPCNEKPKPHSINTLIIEE